MKRANIIFALEVKDGLTWKIVCRGSDKNYLTALGDKSFSRFPKRRVRWLISKP